MTVPGGEHDRADGRDHRPDPTPLIGPGPPVPAATDPRPRHDRPDVDRDGTRPTDVLPRHPPAVEQPTTVLPRRPVPPPPAWMQDLPATPIAAAPPPGATYRSRLPPLPTHRSNPYAVDPAAGRDRYGRPLPALPPQGTHLPPYREPLGGGALPTDGPTTPLAPGGRPLRKITVTRVAAARSRELTLRGVDLFRRATTADGADRSGLAHLTYAQMANYACDAALAVALANTLFLVRPEEGVGRVLLYLLITVAPFTLVAPLIGPFLDRLQTGRRLALALSMAGRGLLAVPMIFTFSGADASWVLYPCALGSLVLSKSFGVLKASLTPRVLPAQITLVATNSRLTVFGLIAGGVAGTIAAGLTWVFGSPGALVFTALLGLSGAWLCLQIPAWVESTEGEVPVHLTPRATRNAPAQLSVDVRVTLWANSAIRIETGFLAMFIAFVVMKEYAAETGFYKLMLLGLVGGAAGVGGFVGNALGAKLNLRSPEMIATIGVVVTILTTLFAALTPGLAMAAVVGFVGSTASSLAKVCLDSAVQRDMPEVSRASAFGRSETALQLSWVFGGVVGLLIGGLLELSHDAVYRIGFGTVTGLVALGLVQTWLSRSGRSLFPSIRFPRRRAARSSRSAQDSAAEPATDPTTAVRPAAAGVPVDPPDQRPRRRPRDARRSRGQ
ncbi:MAG: MFS transporter [Nakamurella sp.]